MMYHSYQCHGILAGCGAAVLASTLLIAACGGSNGGPPANPTPAGVQVSLGSARALDQGQSENFSATVANDSSNQGVTWSLSGAGTLSNATAFAVTYTAPATVSANFTSTIKATSVADAAASATATLIVVSPPTISTPQSLVAGTVGVAYAYQIAASGGEGPLTWAITAGALPVWASLDNTGTVSGTPTAAASTSFTVAFTDANGVASAPVAFTLVVNAPVGSWTQITPSGTAPPVLGPSAQGSFGWSTNYDPASNIMMLYGGWLDSTTQNSAWILTGANGEGAPGWTNTVPEGGSGPEVNRQAGAYDPATNRLLLVDGCESGCTPMSAAQYVITNANGSGGTPALSALSPSGTAPAPRQGAAFAWDATDHSFIIFAGQNGGCCDSTAFNDTFLLTNPTGTAPAWVDLSPTGGPPAGVNEPFGGYNATDNAFVSFGGSDLSSNETNAVWSLSHANGQGGAAVWSQVIASGAGNAPPLTVSRGIQAVYDANDNELFVINFNPDTSTFDVWSLRNADGAPAGAAAWSHLAGGTGPAGNVSSLWYDPISQRLIAIFTDTAAAAQLWYINITP